MSVVSIVKTQGNDYKSIKAAVEKAIGDCGGLSDIVKPGYKVLINPNLVAEPTDRLSGGVTRWEVCKAIAEEVKAEGGVPIIAESSASGVDTERVIKKCEYDKLREEGLQVIDLKKRPKAKIPVDGKIIKELDTWDLVAEADAIISVPIMKTHDQTEVTLGMKNLKGLISDVQKKSFHTLGVVEGVTDIVQAVKPVMCVIDGTFGQQGLGPIFGETVEMDLIVASKDIVSCDAVGSLIMGYEVDEPMITVAASKRGLGEKDINKIEVKGEKIESVKRRFKRSNEVEIEGLPEHKLIFAEGACTGCRNTVLSAMMDMKGQDLLKYVEGKIIIAGPLDESELPEDSTPENTILVGKCTNHLKGKGRSVKGCPPGNVFVVQGIVGDEFEVQRRYVSDSQEEDLGR